MRATIRVLLTDDHAVVRSGVRRLLEQYDGIEVVAEACNGEQAYQKYIDHQPDVLVMDMSMPGLGGMESMRRILVRERSAKIIIFSMHENAVFATQALSAGAVAYVAKSADADDLVKAIRAVAAGKHFLSAIMAQRIALQSMSGEDNPTQKLTTREFEVFRLIAEGMVVDEIADLLSISQKTVANYQTLLKQKLDVNSPVELVRIAIRQGIIEG